MVQIYQNEELNDIMFQVEALDEWKQVAGELELDNQLNFLKVAESPIPYPWMNTTMKTIFETLCPCKVDFKKYDKTPIPLEVLKQIALSVRDKHFQEIEIWYDDKTPDPAVIGKTQQFYCYDKAYKHMKGANGLTLYFPTRTEAEQYAEVTGFQLSGTSEFETKHYLIARWADVVRPIAELKELAKERLIDKYGPELKKEIEAKTQALKNLTENVMLFLNGELREHEVRAAKW